MKKTLGFLCIVVCCFISLIGCQDTSSKTYRTVIQIQALDPEGKPIEKVGSRSIIAGEYTVPGYYEVVLQSVADETLVYTSTSTTTSVVFENIFGGTYNLTVHGYSDETKGTLVMYGFLESQPIGYASNKEIDVSIKMMGSGEGLTATVQVTMDWTRSTKKIDEVRLFISDSPDSSSMETWTLAATQKITEANQQTMAFSQEVPVGEDKFIKFLFYQNGTCVGYSIPEVAQLYSGQFVTTSSPESYIFDDATNPFRDALNISDINFVYEAATSTASVSWTNPQAYSKIHVVLYEDPSNTEFFAEHVITAANASEYLVPGTEAMMKTSFDKLKFGTPYRLELYVEHGTGQESEHSITNFTTVKVVTQILLTSSVADADKTTYTKDSTCTITASFTPADAELGNVMTWSVSDPTVLSIEATTDTTATVKALKNGVANVVATSNYDSKVTQSFPITVYYKAPQALAVNVVGNEMRLSWTDNNEGHSGYKIYRNVNNTSYVLLDTIVDITQKTYTLTDHTSSLLKVSTYGTIGGKSFEAFSEPVATVEQASPTITIILPKAPADIANVFTHLNGTQFDADSQLAIELQSPIANAQSYCWFLNGTQLVAGDFESVKSLVISKASQGINLTQKNPSQDIMLVVKIDGRLYSSTLRVFMIDKEQEVPAQSVAITAPASITYGEPQTLGYAVLPENASVKTVNWSSSDPSIATVDSTGLVTVQKSGSVTITASSTVTEGVTDSKTISCIVPVASVAINTPSRSTVFVEGQNGYGSVDLDATVVSAAGASVAATNRTVRWSSANEQVATIDATTGVVTPVSGGSVELYAVTDDGNKRASVSILCVGADLYGGKGYKGDGTDAPVTDTTVSTTGSGGNGETYTFKISSIPSTFVLGDNFSINWNFEKDGGPTEYGTPGIRLRLLSTSGSEIVLNRQANASGKDLYATVKDANGTIVLQRKCHVVS